MAQRVGAYRAAGFSAASVPIIVQEQDRDVLYATWLIGNDYTSASKFYGEYPPSYLNRIAALFADVDDADKLHVFSGSLRTPTITRLDVNPDNQPDVVGSVYDAQAFFGLRRFRLIMADPPYSKADAAKYGTASIHVRRAIAALADIAQIGGHLVWLDTCWPQHRKTQWVTVGRITVVRSTNHRVRMATIFERVA